jgi:hypothetical protein
VKQRSGRVWHLRFVLFLLVCVLTACSSASAELEPTGSSETATTSQTETSGELPPTETSDFDIQIDATNAGAPFDKRLLGSNLPAWLGPERLNDPRFQARTAASGVSVIRLPGGSWSNAYDWLACQTGNLQRGSVECYWEWAAKPSDFLNMLRASNKQAMWTVSLNGTAQEAAALVAFFNGTVDDQRPIGLDRNGVDWRTVGDWAKLRSEAGQPEPFPILLWEVGNEIYGGKKGKNCSEYGWEDVWSCDGREYVHGDASHDGFLAFREAMQAVDPSIAVGAVGLAKQDEWNNWGNDVIAAAGQSMDFYVVHHYPYWQGSKDYAELLAKPQQLWSGIVSDVHAAFDQHAEGRRVPIAITEYNLFAFQDLDNDQLMTQAANALFLADSIGQMAQSGITIANQYNLANGRANNGTDYGMLDADSFARSPQYYVMPLWERFGEQLLPLESRYDSATSLSAYAGRSADGTLSLLVINKTGSPIESTIRFHGVESFGSGSVDQLSSAALDSREVSFNGLSDPADDLSDAASMALEAPSNPLNYSFPAYSVSLIRLQPN